MNILSKNKQKKADVIADLSEKINRAKAIVIADYRGIKHKQLEELRRTLKKAEAEFVVAKNRLMLRALGDRARGLETAFEDTSAAIFSYADEVTPLKELLKFFKTVGLGKTKAGLLGTSVMNDADLAKLATLPPKNVLLGKLVGQLNAPIQGLHYALSWNMNKLVWAIDAIKTKKSS